MGGVQQTRFKKCEICGEDYDTKNNQNRKTCSIKCSLNHFIDALGLFAILWGNIFPAIKSKSDSGSSGKLPCKSPIAHTSIIYYSYLL